MDTAYNRIKQRYSMVEDVYYSLQGELCEPLPNVENAFAIGSVCDRCYSEMLKAYERICDRLGVQDEDKDVEVIITSLRTITEELCYRMFAYGAELGNSEKAV